MDSKTLIKITGVRHDSAVPNIVCDVYTHAERILESNGINPTNQHKADYDQMVEVVKNLLLAAMMRFRRDE